MPQVVTANRLQDGTVVFLGSSSGWVEGLQDARVIDGKEAVAAALDIARRDEQANLVLDIYAIDVVDRAGILSAVKLREAIRARGPTIHPEFGKPQPAPHEAPEDDHVSV